MGVSQNHYSNRDGAGGEYQQLFFVQRTMTCIVILHNLPRLRICCELCIIFPIYYSITPIYYNIKWGGGFFRDPQIVLRNI